MNFSAQIPAYGSPRWKDPVATSAALPTDGNTTGDARMAIDTHTPYMWDGAAWQSAGGGGGGNAFTIMQPITGTSPTADAPDSALEFISSNSTITVVGNATDKTLDFKVAVAYLPLAGGTLTGTLHCLGQTVDGIATLGANDFFDYALGVNYMSFYGGSVYWRGGWLWRDDNTYDIGGAGANRPKDLNLAGNARIAGNLGVGNSAAGSTLGTVVKKMEVFDAAGVSLGFIPIYDTIT